MPNLLPLLPLRYQLLPRLQARPLSLLSHRFGAVLHSRFACSLSLLAHRDHGQSLGDSCFFSLVPLYLLLDTNVIVHMMDNSEPFSFEKLLAAPPIPSSDRPLIFVLIDTVRQQLDEQKDLKNVVLRHRVNDFFRLVPILEAAVRFFVLFSPSSWSLLTNATSQGYLNRPDVEDFVRVAGYHWATRPGERKPDGFSFDSDGMIIDCGLVLSHMLRTSAPSSGTAPQVLLLTEDVGMRERALQFDMPCDAWARVNDGFKASGPPISVVSILSYLQPDTAEMLLANSKAPALRLRSVHEELRDAGEVVRSLCRLVQQFQSLHAVGCTCVPCQQAHQLLPPATASADAWFQMFVARSPTSPQTPMPARAYSNFSRPSPSTPNSRYPPRVPYVSPHPHHQQPGSNSPSSPQSTNSTHNSPFKPHLADARPYSPGRGSKRGGGRGFRGKRHSYD